MTAVNFYFGDFVLDPAQRQLRQATTPVELNSRYLDALLLLLQNAGNLVTKQQFFAQVWPGMVVSDEALTQCIRTLRRTLNDNASAPRFIETVPKHGYRFIARVEYSEPLTSTQAALTKTESLARAEHLVTFWQSLSHGVIGAVLAGLVGGMLYGVAAAVQALLVGSQAISIMLVLLSITTLLALVAGIAVAGSLSAALIWRPKQPLWLVLSGALGGLFVGGFVSVLLTEVLSLFFGRSPGQITGAAEGLLLGLAAALAYLLLNQQPVYKRVIKALLSGALAGLVVSISGGVLLAGSLVQLAAEFPEAALAKLMVPAQLIRPAYGNWPVILMTMLEAGLFTAGLTLGLQRAQRRV